MERARAFLFFRGHAGFVWFGMILFFANIVLVVWFAKVVTTVTRRWPRVSRRVNQMLLCSYVCLFVCVESVFKTARKMLLFFVLLCRQFISCALAP